LQNKNISTKKKKKNTNTLHIMCSSGGGAIETREARASLGFGQLRLSLT
jgi:hypothetical protein